jgi:hypothetical protein
MSWQQKVKQAGLLAGFCLLFFTGCKKNDEEFYLEGVDERYNVERIDTSTVVVSTERMGKVNTLNLTSNFHVSSDLAGTFNDPVFGRSTSIVYSSIERGSNPTFTASSTVDSFILYIRLHSYPYGAVGAPAETHRWEIHELKSKLDRNKPYYSDTNLAISPEYIPYEGVLSFTDSMLKINMISSNFPGFANKFLSADPEVYKSDASFADFFNGFAIIPDTTDPFSKTGAIVSLNLDDAASKLVLYHDGNKSYTMTFGNARINAYKHNYTGTPVAQALNNSSSPNVYMQSMAGLRLNVQMPNLKNYVKDKKLALHKAELVFTDVDSPGDAYRTSRPARVFIVEREQNGGNTSLFVFPDFTLGEDTYYDGWYNAAKKTYTLGITRHIQNLLEEYNANPGAADYGLNLYIPAAEPLAPSRAIIANSGTMRPKLVLTFTKLKE